METVNELLSIINNGPSTCTASKKDELKVMKALMNDTSYNVDVYGANGKERSFNPSTELRDMCASVISSAAKISINEAKSLMKDHEFKKSEAEQMITVKNLSLHIFRLDVNLLLVVESFLMYLLHLRKFLLENVHILNALGMIKRVERRFMHLVKYMYQHMNL